ncbi:MAG: hypothetical protein JW862_04120 [Anaerolineales bacterium]|nr:hypothetical protein [Anaerolineales bacterium]
MVGDDVVSIPLPLPFSFPFYENAYNEIYVSSNGLLTFEQGNTSYNNHEMPFIVAPQNFIAPFWDDLHVPSLTNGKVYYHGNSERFVISWHDVARFPNTVDLLTFQAILFSNGNICFQYHTLTGVLNSAGVGIEDKDGADGLTYLNDAPGLDALAGTKQLCFIRPGQNYRVKMLPLYQGDFVIRGTAYYDFQLTNNGNRGSDSYEINAVSTDPTWSVSILNASGQELPDANKNGKAETGPVAQGQSLDLVARITAPPTALVGDHARLTLTAISFNDPIRQWSIDLYGAVPSPFVQGVVIEDDISLLMVYPDDRIFPLVSPNYTGSTIGVLYLPGDRYLYMWERNDISGKIDYTDLEFAVLSGFGSADQGPGKVTANLAASSYDYQITDRSPVSAVTGDGKIGLMWGRTVWNGTAREEQSNIFFALYDSNNMNTPLVGPLNITQNTQWAGSGSTNVPVYGNPRIALTVNGRFAMTWTDNRNQVDGDETSIGVAIYDQIGTQRFFTERIPGLNSTPGSIQYRDPDIQGLSDGNLLISFAREDSFAFTVIPGYLVLDTDGNTVYAPTLLPGVQGQSTQVMQFDAGPVLMGWIDSQDRQIGFVTINPAVNYAISSGPTRLETPQGLSADLLSISQDGLGNAVVTWMDFDEEQNIYYALLRSTGAVLTPPIQFYDAGGQTITVSKIGASNATYIGKPRVLMPSIRK